MKRSDLQWALAEAIDRARRAVARQGRDAMCIAVYRYGDRIFACLDGKNAVEVKGDQVIPAVIPLPEFNRYIRLENRRTLPCEFNFPVKTLRLLLKMFREVAAL